MVTDKAQEILADWLNRRVAKSMGFSPEWESVSQEMKDSFLADAGEAIQALSEAGLEVVEKPEPKPASAWFMFDSHAFRKLTGMSVEDAMAEVTRCTDRDHGYGFVSVEVNGDKEIFQWRPEDVWREKVRDMLSRLPAPQDIKEGEHG